MITQLVLKPEHLQHMLRHVEELAPFEACGLLAGEHERVERVLTVRNQAESTDRFTMDPYEQLRAFQEIDSAGLELLGIFHSHPAGPETVSPTDIAEAAYDVVHVICSRLEGKWKARGFWIENGQPREVPLLIDPL